MSVIAALPTLNATLNAASAVLLVAGLLAIRRRRVHVHRACMAAANSLSRAKNPLSSFRTVTGRTWSSERPDAILVCPT